LFAFDAVTKAIQPALSLGSILKHWREIALGLSETTRKRKSQAEKYCTLSHKIS
jgi:hypothetical protein